MFYRPTGINLAATNSLPAPPTAGATALSRAAEQLLLFVLTILVRQRREIGTLQKRCQALEQERSALLARLTPHLSEAELMDLTASQPARYVQLSPAELQAIEEEPIGQHFSHHPYLY